MQIFQELNQRYCGLFDIPCIIHGTGETAKQLIAIYAGQGKKNNIRFITDPDQKKADTQIEGITIISPGDAVQQGLPIVIASQWAEDIMARYRASGFEQVLPSFFNRTRNSKLSPVLTQIEQAYELLSDDDSKIVFESRIERFLKAGKISKSNYEQYFHPATPTGSVNVVLDLGACIGGNLSKFESHFSSCTDIVLLEPDKDNFSKLKVRANRTGVTRRVPLNLGVWSRKDKLVFLNSANANHIGSARILRDDISDQSTTIEVTSIDSLCRELKLKPDFIKFDIEGAEIEALKGAENTLKEHKPALAVCVYHYMEDLWEIPNLIKALQPDYRFYLGHHSDNDWETVLYCF